MAHGLRVTQRPRRCGAFAALPPTGSGKTVAEVPLARARIRWMRSSQGHACRGSTRPAGRLYRVAFFAAQAREKTL
ncbi:hypothetical protein TB9_00255 [Xanthomonas perforans]|uniref:Uncharacterized protein n=1 Tax=Xanthomonas perforans TaxID=442694 RepID=A0AAQ0YPB5_XANPE|nr:hypothetical protein XP315_13905 [Xanthomonas perforans]KLC17629.1 hypothetical protein XP712_15575 [Xanthomonas perforans]KLC23143.1 hypothetical protein XP816_15575 [Xanthomonas perforans]KLC32086.1 hypothetical protein XP95_09605 [Xanthomonas perforans]KLC37842.1 hypothetical protein XP1013_03325 [Xanthomonas perforans]